MIPVGTELGFEALVSLPPTLQTGRLAATSDLETCRSVDFSLVTVCLGLLGVTVGNLLHDSDVLCKYKPKGNEETPTQRDMATLPPPCALQNHLQQPRSEVISGSVHS